MATFGYTSNGGIEDGTDDAVLAYRWKYTGKTGATISSGSWRGRRASGTGTSTVWLALYSDNGTGQPCDRLDLISASLALTSSVTTFTVNQAGTYPLVNGEYYWIAASCNLGSGWCNEYDSDAAVDTSYKLTTTVAPSDPWGSESGSLTWKLAFYFNTDEANGTNLAIIATATFASTTGTTGGTITIPTVSVDDELEVLVISRDHTSGTAYATCTDNDTGGDTWTRAITSTDRKSYLFRKKATSGTSGKTITIAGAVGSCAGGLTVIRGSASGDPNTDLSVEDNASGDESHATFTPTQANSMICFGVFDTGNDTDVVTLMGCTTPGHLPQVWFRLSTGGSDCRVQQFIGAQSGGPTATGALTWAQTNSTTKSIAWAIKPATTGYTLTMDAGMFALTGQAMFLKASRKLALSAGSFTLTGQNISLRHGYTLATSPGSFALTGQAMFLKASRKLALSAGIFTLTGQNINLKAARKLALDFGAFTLTGQAISLKAARKLALSAGAFTLTGENIALRVARKLSLSTGIFVLTGIDIVLTRTGGASTYTLTMDPGIFALSGQAMNLKVDRKLALSPGSFTLTGQNVNLRAARKISISPALFTLTGQDARLLFGRRLVMEPGIFTLTGQDAHLVVDRILQLLPGEFHLTGQDILMYTPIRIVEPGFAEFTLDPSTALPRLHSQSEDRTGRVGSQGSNRLSTDIDSSVTHTGKVKR